MAVDPSDRQGASASSSVPTPEGAVKQAGLTERDVEGIADRVYRLMLSDMRLELARGERPPNHPRRES